MIGNCGIKVEQLTRIEELDTALELLIFLAKELKTHENTYQVYRVVVMEELRLQIIVACQKMITPTDDFRTRIRNHMSDNQRHMNDTLLQAHWSQIVAAIMSADPKNLPDTAKDPTLIYVIRLRQVHTLIIQNLTPEVSGSIPSPATIFYFFNLGV